MIIIGAAHDVIDTGRLSGSYGVLPVAAARPARAKVPTSSS
jgi:hypothetical protein